MDRLRRGDKRPATFLLRILGRLVVDPDHFLRLVKLHVWRRTGILVFDLRNLFSDLPAQRGQLVIQRLPLLFESIEVPVIAAVNGPAVGAACDLTCMCDIRIASDKAKFAESFVKIGLVAGDGGAWLLPRVIGWAKASEMAFTGRMIDANEALACGLVSRVVAPEALMDEARALAAQIAANPPHAVRMTKRLIRESRLASLSAILEASAAAQALCHTTRDHQEAVDAFFEKRAPQFDGN